MHTLLVALLVLSAGDATAQVRELPAELAGGWRLARTEETAEPAEVAALPPSAWRALDTSTSRPPGEGVWLERSLEIAAGLARKPLALQVRGLLPLDEVFLDGEPLEPVASLSSRVPSAGRVDRVFPLPPGNGTRRILVRLSARWTSEPLWSSPPLLDDISRIFSREGRRSLPLLVAVLTLASFALLGVLYFGAGGRRPELALYAVFAGALALHASAPLPLWTAASVSDDNFARAADGLRFLVPLFGYAFLLRFLELPVILARKLLLLAPLAGCAAAVLAGREMAPAWSSAALPLLFVLAGDVLVAIVRQRRRQRANRALLFAGTAALLLGALADAGAAQGVLVSGVPACGLTGPAFVLFTGLLLAVLADEGRQLFAKATTDPLTNLLNRAAFLERAAAEVARAERTGRSVALVMLDVDHFKSFNDRFGHQAGDRVLSAVGQAVAETVRGIDIPGRYGGEEFILLLVEVDEAAALAAVERVRAAIAAVKPPRVPEPIRVSAGVAVHHGLFERSRVAELIKRADAALYESKEAGRDRTTLEDPRKQPPKTAADVWFR